MKPYPKLPYYKTTVDLMKTQGEIRTFLMKYGLKGTRFTEYQDIGVLEFIIEIEGMERGFRFEFNLPEEENYKKQVYRALFYYLKARFTSVDFGIRTIEQEFLSELILKLPNGTTSTIRNLVGKKMNELEFESDLLLPLREGRTDD